MVSILGPTVRGKKLRSEETNFSAIQYTTIKKFAKKYIPHL